MPTPIRFWPSRRAVLVALAAVPQLARGVRAAGATDAAAARHGLSLFGDLKYPAGFAHFDYVNAGAPKGGAVRYSSIGTFDTLNPFTLKGQAEPAIGMIFDTLLEPAYDEPASSYGLLAESVAVAADRRSVSYTLRREARFSDGAPVTPEDAIFTFDTLKTKGHPRFRLYYADVLKAEKTGERSVTFHFRSNDNRELPAIVGEMPVLSKTYWASRDFAKTTLEPPLGSGAYKVENVDQGRSIVYRRRADYWGKDLAVNVGRGNFDTIRYDYYRDPSIALEAFKAGDFDIRRENISKIWATGYQGPALAAGFIVKDAIPNQVPQGMQGFGFNLRKPLFQDVRVRRALGYLFDFEWTNKNLFYNSFSRTESYFSNSDCASSGLPGPDELAILKPLESELPPGTLTEAYEAPKTDGTGNIRDNLRAALRLLLGAGWTVKNETLVGATGEPFRFEFLLTQPIADFERVVLPFAQNLKRAGIAMAVRTVDPAQYQNRMNRFDYDMTVVLYPESPSPGNEQRDFWGSASADQEGGQNLLGIKSKAVDALVDLVIHAPDRTSLVTRTRALDRALLHGYYVIPNWRLPYFWVARWDKFGAPPNPPPYVLALDTWWYDAARAAALEAKRRQQGK